jgi:hypothetical protein
MVGSLSCTSRHADLDPPSCNLGIFLLAYEVDLGGPDVGVPGELAHLVHSRPVADRIVDRRLAQRVNPDPSAPQPPRIDPSCLAVFLHQPPGGLAVQVPPLQPGPVGPHGPEQGPLLVLSDASLCHVGQDRPRRVQQDLSPLLVSLLGDVEVVLDAVGLEVAHAGTDHGRDPAAGDEEDAHQSQVADPLQGVAGDRLQQRDRLPLGQGRRGVLLDAGGLDRPDVWAVSQETSPLATSCL